MKELEYPFDKDYLLSKRRKIKKELLLSDNLIEKRVAILGGSTTSSIKDTLEVFLLNYGIKPLFYESEYNKFYEDAVFSNSVLDEFNPEIVYICTSVRNITNWPSLGMGEDAVSDMLGMELSKYVSVWEALSKRFGCSIVQNNFDMPTFRLMGNYDAVAPYGAVYYVSRLNQAFSAEAYKRNYLNLVDINYISADYGLSKWHDNVAWYSYKYAMNLDAVPELAFNVANIIKAMLGKNKKGFVLDLDNTLWGGIVGDDGPDNIAIGPEIPLGQAYSDFQEYLKKHTDLGIVLAVDSKNDMENAIAGLNHPDGVLKESDFVNIKANWDPKNINLKKIASELSLGADSFVFVDDNPAERMIVADDIPGIAVPPIGKITDYISIINRAGYFETIAVSEDDAKRNEMYKANASRIGFETSFADYGEYLKALEMKAEIKPFNSVYMARIAQLTNKSNQFNLTTRRYTQEEIEECAGSNKYITLYGKLIDKFGDNGVVTVALGHVEGEECHIDLWLMSCRVLKRDMEYAMMDEFIKTCQNRGIKKIIGTYIPTLKNAMVKDFYPNMGFTLLDEKEGTTVWNLDIEREIPRKNCHIEILGE